MSIVFIVSDLQVPYHDRKAVDAVMNCIADYDGTDRRVISIGDEMDMQTISRWSAGTPTEYEKSIGKDRDLTVQVLEDLQVTDVIRSNHTDRLFNTVMRRAPGLLGLPELELENFLRLPELGITFHKEAFNFAPGWLAMHGDESGLRAGAGSTAAGLSAKTGMSVVCGHTHRMGLIPVSEAFNGKISKTRWGFEVGNLMDFASAKYTKGVANWQQGFGAFLIDGKNVHPIPIPIVGRSFTFLGSVYKW
jgi:hypothetical protein